MQFVDLKSQRKAIEDELNYRLSGVLEHGRFIMGPEVFELEEELSSFCGASEVVTCGSGTDALILPLMAWGIGAGDAVYVPSFTFAATAEAVALVGATPIFVDVLPDTFNMDPESLTEAIRSTNGLRPTAMIPVDLFGLPADYPTLNAIAATHGLHVLADAAQSFGARAGEHSVGSLAEVTATSFFPSKPLGCYGDGGAIMTDDTVHAETLRSLRVHGQGSHKYENLRVGTNARLDSMQAAVLLEKLRIFRSELETRSKIAATYSEDLGGHVTTPKVPSGLTSAWAQYTVRVPVRDRVAARLQEEGIPTAVYYPMPLHLQPAYRSFPRTPSGLSISEQLSGEVLSLPIHPYLTDEEVQRVVQGLRDACAS